MPSARSSRALSRRFRALTSRVDTECQGLLLFSVSIVHAPVLTCGLHQQEYALALCVLVAGWCAAVFDLANESVNQGHIASV